MKAAIRSLLSFDVDDLARWNPDGDTWVLAIRLIAGPYDEPGEESFDFTVCSVGWISERIRQDPVFDGRHHLIVESFDWPTLRDYVARRVERCDGATWRDVAQKLARLGYWEFEDYQP